MPEFDSTIRYSDIPGLTGYKAGTDGSIWSCWTGVYPTGVGIGRQGRIAILGTSWRRLRPGDKGRGYLVVSINGHMRRIARLVLETFVGPCPEGMEACHFPDRDPGNNAVSNLRWDTHINNSRDRNAHGTSNCGERNAFAKLTAAMVFAIRAEYTTRRLTGMRAGFKKMRQGELATIAAKYNVTCITIGKIMRGERWRHLL